MPSLHVTKMGRLQNRGELLDDGMSANVFGRRKDSRSRVEGDTNTRSGDLICELAASEQCLVHWMGAILVRSRHAALAQDDDNFASQEQQDFPQIYLALLPGAKFLLA